MSIPLETAVLELERVRESLPKTSVDPEIPRLLAIARTHIQTAELFIAKASELVP